MTNQTTMQETGNSIYKNIFMDNFKHPYTQSIRFTADGFCLCLNDDKKEIVAHKTFVNFRKCSSAELTAKLQSALNESEFKPELEVRVIFDTHHFTVIPADVFGEDDYQELLKFLFTGYKNEECQILSNNLTNGCTLVYSVNQLQYSSIQKSGIKTIFSNQFEELNRLSKDYSGKTIVCRLTNGMSDIACYDNNSLLLINRYDCPTPEDTLYYLLQTAETTFGSQTNEITYVISEYSTDDRNLLDSKLNQTVFI